MITVYMISGGWRKNRSDGLLITFLCITDQVMITMMIMMWLKWKRVDYINIMKTHVCFYCHMCVYLRSVDVMRKKNISVCETFVNKKNPFILFHCFFLLLLLKWQKENRIFFPFVIIFVFGSWNCCCWQHWFSSKISWSFFFLLYR